MVALAATALFFQGSLRDERAETARWKERAYEAEARLALLRAEVESAERATPPVAAAPAPRAPGAGAAAPPQPEPPAPEAPPALDDPVWDALVAGHLRSEVQRMGYDLAPEQEQRLLGRLRDVRDAGAHLDEDPGDDPLAGARQRLSRSIVLLEADRAFREELGVGLAAFLRRLDGGQVEEVGAVAPPTDPGETEFGETAEGPAGMTAAGRRTDPD